MAQNKPTVNKKQKKQMTTTMMIVIIVATLVLAIGIGLLVKEIYSHYSETTKLDNVPSTSDTQALNLDAAVSGSGIDGVEQKMGYDYEDVEYINFPEYKNLKASVEATQDDVDEKVSELFQENMLKKGKATKESLIEADYEAYLDGTKLDSASEEDAMIDLTDQTYVDGFTAGIVGMTVGKTKSYEVTFPSDYDEEEGDDSLNGKTVTFKVKLKSISPTYDDAFVVKVSKGKYKTTKEYDEVLKSEVKQDNIDALSETLWEQIIADDVCSVTTYPEGDVDTVSDEIYQQYASFAEMQSEDGAEVTAEDVLTAYGMTTDDLDEMAQETVRDRMIAATIVYREGLVLTEDKYKSYLMTSLDYDESEEKTVEELEQEYSESVSANVKGDMMVMLAKDFVLDHAVVQGNDK